MIDIVHIGLGPLGQMMVRSAVERGSFRIVEAEEGQVAETSERASPCRNQVYSDRTRARERTLCEKLQ